jgi:hypothetical protein
LIPGSSESLLLPTLIREVERGIDGAYVKFPMQTPQGLTEHIRGYVHFHKDGEFNVSLAKEATKGQPFNIAQLMTLR